MYVFGTSSPIGSLTDVVQSQINHYFAWGGRNIVHGIAQIFLSFDKSLFNIINTLAYLALTLLIYVHATYNGGKSIKISYFIYIHILIWYFLPDYAESQLWLTGSSNYLWGSLIQLAFLLPFRIRFEREPQLNNKKFIMSILIFPAGIIAAWTNENTGAALVLMLIMYIIYHKVKKQMLPAWVYTGAIGSVIGLVIMVIAPGNYVRATYFNNSEFFLFRWVKNFVVYSVQGIKYLSIILLLIGICYILNKYVLGRKLPLKIIAKLIFYSFGGLISIYSMVISPGDFPDRSWSGIIYYMIIAFGVVYSYLDFNCIAIRRIMQITVVCLMLSFITSYRTNHTEINNLYQQWVERENYIESQKEKGYMEVQVPRIYSSSKYALYEFDISFVENESIARYYGVDSIVAVNAENK